MIKSSLAIKQDVHINKYPKLINFLKKQNKGYTAKKSKTLSRKNIIEFLLHSPDETYLMWKVCILTY